MLTKVVFSILLIVSLVTLSIVTDVSLGETFDEPNIKILSPSDKQVERNTTVELMIDVLFVSTDKPKGVQISYKLDNNSITPLNNLEMSQWSNGWWTVWGKTVLVDLDEGSHKLTAYSINSAGLKTNTTTAFTVDTGYEYPKIAVLSPQNKTYNTADIPIVFFVNGNISEGFVYLDAYPNLGKNFPIDNTTLSELKDGDYKLYFSATTERGQITKTVAFSVNATFYKNLIISITIGIIAILLTVMVLLSYKTKIKKRKHASILSKDLFPQQGVPTPVLLI